MPLRFVPGGGASRRAWIESGMFTGAALLVLIALAAWTAGSATALAARAANWHLAVALPLYFGWGLLQQYIFQRFLFGRLLQLLPPAAAIALTAIAFSSVHFPRWPVMALVLIACRFPWSRDLLPHARASAARGVARPTRLGAALLGIRQRLVAALAGLVSGSLETRTASCEGE